MEPRIIERDELIVVGMVYYGNPFHAEGVTPEENEVGKLWTRFNAYWDAHREAFKHEYAPQIRSAFQRGLQQLDPKARTVLRQHLLDGLSQRQIAKLYGVDHKTVGRRLERARDEVWTAVRDELERTLALDSAQLRSVIELVRSQLDLSLSRML